MPTKKLYMQDTYKFTHSSKVTGLGRDDLGIFIILDETIFHPQGGGQPSDQGVINGIKVVKLVHAGDDIKHYLEVDPGFLVDTKVELHVDKIRRLENAALHTTGHLLAAILREKFGLIEQTGAHHFPGESRVTFKGLVPPAADAIIVAVQNATIEKLAVNVVHIDGNRCIEITGFAPGRCGGTHLLNIAEIKGFDFRRIKVDAKKGEISFGYIVSYDHEYVRGGSAVGEDAQSCESDLSGFARSTERIAMAYPLDMANTNIGERPPVTRDPFIRAIAESAATGELYRVARPVFETTTDNDGMLSSVVPAVSNE